jgi:TRAP-type C4-dicarboxylate transport system permease small subunit
MKKALIAGAVYALPVLLFAQTLIETTRTVGRIVNTVVPIIGALLLIYFFWGAVQYVSAKGDEGSRTEARNRMIYAVIGMFVAFSIFGLVRLLATTVGLSGSDLGAREALPIPGNLGPR